MSPRLAVLTDFPEEGWTSMDLCGDMLLAHMPRDGPLATDVARVCPPFRRLATRIPMGGGRNLALNADRLFNRFLHFPRQARRLAERFDVFHIADHTYAQLVHVLPADRVGVYCHDLDAFRSLLEPAREPRPRWYRALARRILSGMQKAAVVFHSTRAVREQIHRAGLVAPERLVLVPYGLASEFTGDPPRLPIRMAWLDDLRGRPWILHVGSCIPRKRIDVLLDICDEVRRSVPDALLVKVGGEWTAAQRVQMDRLGLDGAILHVTGLRRAELAEVYRRAPVVLMPSEAEGFGLPVIEALACGAAVLASDIPALREAGGTAALYAPVGDVAAWSDLVAKLLADPTDAPPRSDRIAWASRFTWKAHAETIASTYQKLLRVMPEQLDTLRLSELTLQRRSSGKGRTELRKG